MCEDPDFFSEMPGFLALKRSRGTEPQEDIFISIPEKRVATIHDVENSLNQLDLNNTQAGKEKRYR